MNKYFGIWKSITDLSDDYGVNYVTASAWAQRGEIPRTYDFTTLRVIKVRGFTATPEGLDSWHKAHKKVRADLRAGFPKSRIVTPVLPFSPLQSVGAAE